MLSESHAHLKNYKRKHPLRFPTYLDNNGDTCINYDVPHLADAMEIVHPDGVAFPRILGARRRRCSLGNLKSRPCRRNYNEQLLHAFDLMETSFDLMEQHLAFVSQPQSQVPRPHRPSLEVECRASASFESGNWMRFCQVWLIYLGALRADSLLEKEHVIDLDYDCKATKLTNIEEANSSLEKYKARIYGIIHRGKSQVPFAL